jgi:hypothetical protein
MSVVAPNGTWEIRRVAASGMTSTDDPLTILPLIRLAKPSR